MERVRFSDKYAIDGGFLTNGEISAMSENAERARKTLLEKSGQGADFTGWVDLPECYDKEEYARITDAAEKIKGESEVLVVIGIGGSYLGAKAATEFLLPDYYNFLDEAQRKGPKIFFAGNSISTDNISGLIKAIGDSDFSVNVISKSGTTTEPAIAFRIFEGLLEKKYGRSGASKRIYATTDGKKGALKSMADEKGYQTFIVPDDIGGRYSVLTPVGLLPIAAMGIDTNELLAGAAYFRKMCRDEAFENNDSLRYAAERNIFYRKGKAVEILANYEPCEHFIAEWWKQLFGESEGKENKGIYPDSLDFTTDLHSMGQFIQEGTRIMFETVLSLEKTLDAVAVERKEKDADGLNYLAGRTLDYVNRQARIGTTLAHTDGKVPCLEVSIPARDPFYLGQLFYFFEFACGVSGYMLGINPFNQPGVEYYKKNMFRLLGKPGY